MRLGYFTMPLHPSHRDWAQTLQEDRQDIILADKLGFYDAFVGEHLADGCETITNSMMFLATLISETKQIKLATGTSNLSQMHPVLIASNAAMMDHLTHGRFIFGISAGALPADAEVLGTFDEDRNKMFAEAIDVILAVWERDPPYDIDFPGNRWKVSSRRTFSRELSLGWIKKPYQKPRMEIVGTVVAPHSKGVIEMGKRDFHPLSANFLMSYYLKSHWDNYVAGKAAVGAKTDPSEWRVARTVFVADDERTAARYGFEDERSPYRFYYRQLFGKMSKGPRIALFKAHPDQRDEDVSIDAVLDRLVLYGTVNQVVDKILALREEIGDFGELVYAGMDWVDPALAKRSMQLLAEEVMPRVNAAIKKSAAAA